MSLWEALTSGVIKAVDGFANEDGSSCAECCSVFPSRVRRHRCRKCFRVVCAACSSHLLSISGDQVKHRVCDTCFKNTNTSLDAENSDVVTDHLDSFMINLQNVEVLPPLHIPENRVYYCNVIHGDKVVRTTSYSSDCCWNESFRVQARLSSPLESFVAIELWEKQNKLSGDKCIAKCRVSLCHKFSDQACIDAWYPLIGKHHHLSSRIRVCLAQDEIFARALSPLSTYCIAQIPGSSVLALLPLELKMQRTIPLVVIFPPSAPLHKILFLPLSQDASGEQSHIPFRSNADITSNVNISPPVIEIPNPKHYIPSNEVLLETLEYVWLRLYFGQSISSKYYQGVLLATSHRLIFIEYLNKSRSPCSATTIPYSTIASATIKREWKEGFDALEIICFDGIIFSFACERRDRPNEMRLLQSFQRMKVEVEWRREEDMFSYCANIVALSAIEDPIRKDTNADCGVESTMEFLLENEYRRLGIENRNEWRVTSANNNFKLCGSYPKNLVVPSSVSDMLLDVAATQRSSKRLPVLTWIHPLTGAALCRSSQPLTGINNAACPEDEKLLLAIRATVVDANDEVDAAIWCEDVEPGQGSMSSSWANIRDIGGTHPLAAPIISDNSLNLPNGVSVGDIKISSKRLRIMDCRPGMYAKGNALLGKGHEVISRLGGQSCTTIEFAGIDNIHAMRKSFNAVRCACLDSANPDYLQTLHQSKWLHHLSALLSTSVRVASQLDRGDPVLVHCSDGWDRTSQVTALAQILLDPYYRTIDGFRVLIFKDFVSFGHKFRARAGIKEVGESSPIFFQFLDAVWQIWRQQPWQFQFTDRLLEVLVYAAQSRFTDDFIFDHMMERENTSHGSSFMLNCNLDASPGRVSVWTHVECNRHLYLNPLYSCGIQNVGHVSCDTHRVAAAMMNLNDDPCHHGGMYYSDNEYLDKALMSHPCCGRGLAPAVSHEEPAERYWPQNRVASSDTCAVPDNNKEEDANIPPSRLFYAASDSPEPSMQRVKSADRSETYQGMCSEISLLWPRCDVKQLAIWESMFQRAIPHADCIAGSSAAYQNGIVALAESSAIATNDLLLQIETLKIALNVEKEKVESLMRTSNDPRHDSIDDDTILVREPDDTDLEQANCKILSTGSLIENYL